MVDDFYPKFSALLKDRGDPLELMEHVEVRERGELYNLLSPQFQCSPEIQINQFNGGSRYTQCPVMINGELFFSSCIFQSRCLFAISTSFLLVGNSFPLSQTFDIQCCM